MKTIRSKAPEPSKPEVNSLESREERVLRAHAHDVDAVVDVAALSGAVAGATMGAIAGPPGVVAGGAMGAVVGALAGAALERDDLRRTRHDEDLDKEIGVIDGEMGAASPDAPPARVGAYSAASAGVSRPATPAPAEGGIQTLDDDGDWND
jgi:hypothetical protein